MLGHWRGIQVKDGKPGNFSLGHYDMIFESDTVSISDPNGTKANYAAQSFLSEVGHVQYISLTDSATNVTLKFLVQDLGVLSHTRAVGLATRGPGQP